MSFPFSLGCRKGMKNKINNSLASAAGLRGFQPPHFAADVKEQLISLNFSLPGALTVMAPPEL